MKILLSILFSFLFISTVISQDFDSAAGIRFGFPLSASYKKFVDDSKAFEVYAGYRRGFLDVNFINISAAYQIHKDIEEADRLQWYYGGGVNAYLVESTAVFGISGYLGLSYTLENTPINASLDWTPTIFLNGLLGGFGSGFGSLAVRYVLGSDL